MPTNRVQYTLRIEAEIIDKMRVMAEEESRSLNNMMEVSLKQAIRRYEAEYGPIQLPESDRDLSSSL